MTNFRSRKDGSHYPISRSRKTGTMQKGTAHLSVPKTITHSKQIDFANALKITNMLPRKTIVQDGITFSVLVFEPNQLYYVQDNRSLNEANEIRRFSKYQIKHFNDYGGFPKGTKYLIGPPRRNGAVGTYILIPKDYNPKSKSE